MIQEIKNVIVGALIRLFARIAGVEPIDWLVSISGSAELDQESFNKLVGTL